MLSGTPKKSSLPAVIEKTAECDDDGLSANELREVSENISRYYPPKISLQQKSLVLLPIDAKNLYVYWSLGDVQAMQPSQSVLEKALTLRVYAPVSKMQKSEQSSAVYELKVDSAQARKKIHLPTESSSGAIIASIGQHDEEDGFLPLVSTQAVNIPGTVDPPSLAAAVAESKAQQKEHTKPVETQTRVVPSINKKIHYAANIRSGQRNPHK